MRKDNFQAFVFIVATSLPELKNTNNNVMLINTLDYTSSIIYGEQEKKKVPGTRLPQSIYYYRSLYIFSETTTK